MTGSQEASRRRSLAGRWSSPGRVIGIAALGSTVALTGVQGVAPALPATQLAFGLSTAQVALITSVYLFPSMFSAFGAGLLADRIGARPVLVGSLAVLGLGAAVLPLVDSLWLLLVVRFGQGAAFGAVLSLSVAVIGRVAPTGAAAARGQSHRVVLMAVGEGAFPVIGGLLVAVGWWAPFSLGVICLPVAVLAWLVVPDMRVARKVSARASTRTVLAAPAVLGVQLLGALRLVFKYALLTYFPLLAEDVLGMSPAAVGAALGISFGLCAVAAALTDRLVARWTSAQVLTACLVLSVLTVAAVGAAPVAWIAVLALVVFGVQDGVGGVAHNVLVTELAPRDAWSTYIGLVGTTRNAGKFVAPMLFGAATLVVSVGHGFLLLAALGAVATGVMPGVTRAQAAAARDAAAVPGPASEGPRDGAEPGGVERPSDGAGPGTVR